MVERGELTVNGAVGMEWLNKMEKFRLLGRKEKASPGKKTNNTSLLICLQCPALNRVKKKKKQPKSETQN